MDTKFYLPLLFLLVFFCNSSNAQNTFMEGFNYQYLDKLVASAKELYPRTKSQQARVAEAKENINLEKANWLSPLSFSYFWRSNEQATNLVDPRLFSGYQFGVNLNPGELLSRPFAIRRAKKQMEIAQYEEKETELNVEATVKTRYVTFIQAQNALRLQLKSIQELKNIVTQAKIAYQKGEISLKEYNDSAVSVFEANQTLTEMESRMLSAKFALEELTVKKLEEIK